LESFGLRCVYAGDIRSGQDALALKHYGAADAIITNPPHGGVTGLGQFDRLRGDVR
jgi:hypothetical protein